MPRRSSASTRTSAPSRNVPAPVQQPSPPAHMYNQAPVKQPGLFAQMAATAGGVAVGSAVGHTVGAALTGAFSGNSSNAPQQQPQQQQPQQTYQQPQQYNQNPCFQQLQQFLECTQGSSDITMCQGFNDALKDCKLRYGL